MVIDGSERRHIIGWAVCEDCAAAAILRRSTGATVQRVWGTPVRTTMMLIQTMIKATCKAAHEYFSWCEAGNLSPATRKAQSDRARRELVRLGQELLPVLPDPSALMRLLTAMNDDCEAGVEEALWDAAQVELDRVYEQPHLARQPAIPIVSWSRNWGWQKDWDSRRA